MPAERLTMRKIREVFRLKFDSDISNRQIAKSCNLARSTVAEYLFRFQQAALSWPLPQDIDDNQLEQLLYPQLPTLSPHERTLPDWPYIHQQLRQKSVTLMLLWQEHKELHPQGHQYSQFCHLYRQWAAKIDPVMRQEHQVADFRRNRRPTSSGLGGRNHRNRHCNSGLGSTTLSGPIRRLTT